MKVERVLIIVLALALAFTLGVQLSQAQVHAPGRAEARALNAPAAALDDKIMIQGRLTDASGNPLNGNYSITASIYDVSSGGTARCAETASVSVSNGLFNMGLDGCDNSDINGDQLYLGIKVGTDAEMTPRQGIYGVPYAHSLRPGAIVSGTVASDATLHVVNSATDGRAVRGYALATSGTNYGVMGRSYSSSGYGGYFSNSNGGTALYADGKVAQNLAASGLVKAAINARCSSTDSSMNYYFNNVNNNAITISNGGVEGRCLVDLNFLTDDRFFIASAHNTVDPRGVMCEFFLHLGVNDALYCQRFNPVTGEGADGSIMILIY